MLVLTFFTKKEDPAYRSFLFLCVVMLCWNVIQIMFSMSQEPDMIEMFFHMQMAAIPFMPVALLLYVLRSSGFDSLSSAKYTAALCVIPVITVIINFTNDYHGLFRTYFAVVETVPVRVFINERGPWFWVHTLYSYLMVASGAAVAVYKMRSVTRASRLRYYMALVGVTFTVPMNLIVLFIVPETPVDSTLWGATLSLFFLYFAMDTSPTSNYMRARNQVFDAIGEYIFVLSTDDAISDINNSARKWLASRGIMSDPLTRDQLFTQLADHGAVMERDDSGRVELFFPFRQDSLFSSYTLKTNNIYGKKGEVAGSIITFSDMTAIRETLRNLQAISTIDELTGTYNRRGYEKMLANYVGGNVLPLCVIIGDVNGLKQVNDTYGHSVGDCILRTAAHILVECVGAKGIVARIGGDEFAIVLPGFGDKESEVMQACLKESFEAHREEMRGAGIALGYAIRTSAEQDLADIISEADKKMYQNKRNDRRRSG